MVASKAIWATEIHYLNDSQELKHLGELIEREVARRSQRPNFNLFYQFRRWLPERLARGRSVYVASFTQNGNLLSQWRGYTPLGKGISVGFNSAALALALRRAGFDLVRCIYDDDEQQQVTSTIVDTLVSLAESVPRPKDQAPASYDYIFERIEPHLLRIAAVLKNPAYKEEEEWRAVSDLSLPDKSNDLPILYREGRAFLVPYVEIKVTNVSGTFDLDRVYVGPTPDAELSVNALKAFLSEKAMAPRDGVLDSSVPFRG